MNYESYGSYPPAAVSEEWGLDGPTNMGRDAELLAQAEQGQGGCRVYSWDGPWISLGMMQVPERDLLPTNPVPWVMRPTGGKAVLHGHDVTVGLALPLSLLARDGESVERLSRSVKTVYRGIIRPMVAALRQCGMPAKLAEETPFVGGKGKTADCFAHVSPNDVVHELTGQKVCGCALRLTSTAVLVQASIPNGPPLVDPRRIYAAPSAMGAFRWDATGFAERLASALSDNSTTRPAN
jgi:lipoate-protein ligase A